jgi:hypothetical protein
MNQIHRESGNYDRGVIMDQGLQEENERQVAAPGRVGRQKDATVALQQLTAMVERGKS